MQHSLLVRSVAREAISRGFVQQCPVERKEFGPWVNRNSHIVCRSLKAHGIYSYVQDRGRSPNGKRVPPAIWVQGRSLVLTSFGFRDPPPEKTIIGEGLLAALSYLIDNKSSGRILTSQEKWDALFQRPDDKPRVVHAWEYFKNRQ